MGYTANENKVSAMVECSCCGGTGLIEYYNSERIAHGRCARCHGEGGYLQTFEYKPFKGKREIQDDRSHFGIPAAKRAIPRPV